jgi:hypothetical protein
MNLSNKKVSQLLIDFNRTDKEDFDSILDRLVATIFPCSLCGSKTLVENGDNFYLCSYRCINKNCHRNKLKLFGCRFTDGISGKDITDRNKKIYKEIINDIDIEFLN